MYLLRLIKMCFRETSKKFWVGKYLSDLYTIRNSWINIDSLWPFPFNFAEDYAINRIQVSEVDL